MGLLGLEGTRRVGVDDPRLPPKLRVALCAGGTIPHALVFEVWTAHGHVAELHRCAGSDGVVGDLLSLLLRAPPRGRIISFGLCFIACHGCSN